ncbi:SRPBCC family protein [Streptosporangium subroseum]|uniref:SRPBCC family protein n=1 Tax=Streptosporangium subroseum TaxID=106412 RepID=UPI003087779D|nr:SRPBCC family protein [Streptosporangium subroseum]
MFAGVLSVMITALLVPTGAVHTPIGIDNSAPVITRDDIFIHAPLHRIWQIQTDVENWPSWQPDVSTVKKLTAGPIRPGSQWVWSTQGLDGIVSTVKQVWPGRRIVWGGPAQGITAVHVWTFTPGRNGVRVHTEESWTGDPVTANVSVLHAALDASLDNWLRNLKNKAESRS